MRSGRLRSTMSHAEVTGQLSPDIAEYVKSSKAVQNAIRYFLSVNATDDVWEQFIEQLTKYVIILLAVS